MPAGHAAGHAAASWTAAEETAVSAVQEHTPCGHVLLISEVGGVAAAVETGHSELRIKAGVEPEWRPQGP